MPKTTIAAARKKRPSLDSLYMTFPLPFAGEQAFVAGQPAPDAHPAPVTFGIRDLFRRFGFIERPPAKRSDDREQRQFEYGHIVSYLPPCTSDIQYLNQFVINLEETLKNRRAGSEWLASEFRRPLMRLSLVIAVSLPNVNWELTDPISCNDQ